MAPDFIILCRLIATTPNTKRHREEASAHPNLQNHKTTPLDLCILRHHTLHTQQQQQQQREAQERITHRTETISSFNTLLKLIERTFSYRKDRFTPIEHNIGQQLSLPIKQTKKEQCSLFSLIRSDAASLSVPVGQEERPTAAASRIATKLAPLRQQREQQHLSGASCW